MREQQWNTYIGQARAEAPNVSADQVMERLQLSVQNGDLPQLEIQVGKAFNFKYWLVMISTVVGLGTAVFLMLPSGNVTSVETVSFQNSIDVERHSAERVNEEDFNDSVHKRKSIETNYSGLPEEMSVTEGTVQISGTEAFVIDDETENPELNWLGESDKEVLVQFYVNAQTSFDELQHIKTQAESYGVDMSFNKTTGLKNRIKIELNLPKTAACESCTSKISANSTGQYQVVFGWALDEDGQASRFLSEEEEDNLMTAKSHDLLPIAPPGEPISPELHERLETEQKETQTQEDNANAHDHIQGLSRIWKFTEETTEEEMEEIKRLAEEKGIELQYKMRSLLSKKAGVQLTVRNGQKKDCSSFYIWSRGEFEAPFGWVEDANGEVICIWKEDLVVKPLP